MTEGMCLLATCLLFAFLDLVCCADRSTECFSGYDTRRAKCSGRLKAVSNEASYKDCCSTDGAKAWKPIAGKDTCIKCVNIVDGVWGDWVEWSKCSATCDYGLMRRERLCNNPAPKHGGTECRGAKQEGKKCYGGKRCPVDGKWSEWSSWSRCSVSCRKGIRIRSRGCTQPRPQFGGKDCVGVSESTQDCEENANCPVDGGWSLWLSWSYCSMTCGGGKQTRSRACNRPSPAFNGEPCKGDKVESSPCEIADECDQRKDDALGSSGSYTSGEGSASSGSGLPSDGDVSVIYPDDGEGSASGSAKAAGDDLDAESGDGSASGMVTSTTTTAADTTTTTTTTAATPVVTQSGEDTDGSTGGKDNDEDGSAVASGRRGDTESSGNGQNEDFFVIKS